MDMELPKSPQRLSQRQMRQARFLGSDEEARAASETIGTVRAILKLAGFSLEERIVLKSQKTGKVYR